jgi:hypothetical protein
VYACTCLLDDYVSLRHYAVRLQLCVIVLCGVSVTVAAWSRVGGRVTLLFLALLFCWIVVLLLVTECPALARPATADICSRESIMQRCSVSVCRWCGRLMPQGNKSRVTRACTARSQCSVHTLAPITCFNTRPPASPVTHPVDIMQEEALQVCIL